MKLKFCNIFDQKIFGPTIEIDANTLIPEKDNYIILKIKDKISTWRVSSRAYVYNNDPIEDHYLVCILVPEDKVLLKKNAI